MKFLLTILFSLVVLSGHCCRCPFISTARAEIEKSSVVLTGKIISSRTIALAADKFINNPEVADTSALQVLHDEYTVLISALYKGKIKTDTVRLFTRYHKHSDCAYKFKTGEEYIIYASYYTMWGYGTSKISQHYLRTNYCTRTRPATDLAEIQEIEKYCKNKKKQKKA